MKANEFIKEYGWDEAKKLIDSVKLKVVINGVDCVPCFILGDGKYLGYDELKRLVESWELVMKLGGLYMAKADTIDLDDLEEASPYWVKIKRAIEDVESCQ